MVKPRASLWRWLIASSWVAGLALVVVSLRTAEHNRALVRQVEGIYRSLELPFGAQVPPVVGTGIDGKEIRADPTEEAHPILVLVFSPFCPVCDENWPAWNLLLARHMARGGAVVPIDITSRVRDDYLRAHGIDGLPVMTGISPETMLSYRFRFTPQTLVLHRGRLVGGWTGRLPDPLILKADSLLGQGKGSLTTLPRTWERATRVSSGLLPACDGLPCATDAECGSRCTCLLGGQDTLGRCRAIR